MQANTINERELVERCMQELCSKAGFAGAQEMVQRDLEFLCDSIEDKTGVLISLSTIKRLLNGQFTRLPQIATLNAICQFLGYENWQEFKKKTRGQSIAMPQVKTRAAFKDNQEGNQDTSDAKVDRFPYKKALLLSGILSIVVIGLLAMFRKEGNKPSHFEKASFSMAKTTNHDIPNTVVFNYNIDDVNADSFFIQQSWDRNRRVRIYKNNYTLTDIYYEPGYHTAKLIANDSIIMTQDVSIPTDRWFFYAKEKITASEVKYIYPSQPFLNGSLQVTKEDLAKNQVDYTNRHDYIEVFFPSQYKYSSDNYHLKARVRINEVINNQCPALMCEIFGQKNFMYFISMPKGCASEITGQFGDTYLNGKSMDLSGLATDARNWQDIEIIVKNKQVSILLNNQPAFTTGYNESCGMITGLGFMSNGLPEVDFVELKTGDGKEIYMNTFD